MKFQRPALPIDEADRQRRLNERPRAEYIAGSEAERRKRPGRPMTAEELGRVLRRHSRDASSIE
jgi:hypothetical protein